MSQRPVRLQMIVSEPWEFGTGPVTMDVLRMFSEDHWSVALVEGWPNAADVIEAVLRSRYEDETLGPLLQGEQVIGSLTVTSRSGLKILLGAVSSLG